VRIPLTPHELQLNRIAQGLIPITEGIAWFERLGSEEQQAVLRVLILITVQAHPLKSEVEPAISQAQLKPTFTPCVMVSKAPIPEKGFHKFGNLPPHEWLKTFRLLTALFGIADRRRRETSRRNGCSHAWHHLADHAH
jgi:hypothetical protein